ncbi:MAG: hypothetical protein ACREID_04970, partial [Planctomycetota bacterium]
MRLLGVLVLGAVAAADWGAERSRFLAAYTKDAAPDARLKALRDLAAADVAPAAELLLNVWEGLQGEAMALRRDLRMAREGMREAERKIAAAQRDKADELRAQRDRLRADEAAADARLARVEVEQAAVLDGIEALRSDEALDWLASKGIERSGDPLLLNTVAACVAAARPTAILVALDRLKKPEHLVPLLRVLARNGPAIGPGLPAALQHLSHRDGAVRAAAAHAVAAAAQAEGVG